MRNLLFIILTVTGFYSNAQLQTAHWYFGQGAGLDFTSGLPVTDYNGQLSTNEGCTAISDENGDLLFYSDGSTVYDRNHSVMPNGTGLFGSFTSTQSGIVLPKLDNCDQYYLFTIDATLLSVPSQHGINYSVIDMTLNNGNGDVIEKNVPVPINGYQRGNEKLTAVVNAEKDGYWVITHYLKNFYAFEVTETGVNFNHVVSPTNFSSLNHVGYLKASADGSKLAVARGGNGGVAVYDFDIATGIASNERIIDDNEPWPNTRNWYGVEFSPNGEILYANFGGHLAQYNLNSSDIRSTEYAINVGTNEFALQRALDGNIYFANGGNRIHRIVNPDVLYDPIAGTGPTYEMNFISLSRNAMFGLPQFLNSYFRVAALFINGAINTGGYCYGTELNFSFCMQGGVVTYILWDFGDGTTSTEESPVKNYDSPGNYTVTLTIVADGETYVRTIEFEIYPLPTISIENPPTICTETSAILTADSNAGTIHWYDDENATTPIFTGNPFTTPALTSTTIYWVESESEEGCFSERIPVTVEVTDGFVPEFDPIDPICFGTEFSLPHEDLTGITGTWSPEIDNTQTTTYTFTPDAGQCTAEELVEITVEILPLPELEITSPIELCTNHSTELSVETDLENTVNWYSNPTNVTPIFTGNPFETPVLTTTTSYWVEVLSEEGCLSEREEILVEVLDEITPQFNQIAPICFGEEFDLPVESLNGITGTWLPAVDNTQTTEYTFTPDPDQCSTQTVTMTVEVVPIPEIMLPSPVEICSGEMVSITVSTTGETLNWYENELDTTPFFTGFTFSDELTETTTLWLEAQTGDCLSERVSFTVTVNPLPTIEAEESNPVCEGNPVELSVITNGNIVNWYESETSTNVIFTGNPFTTPNLNETTIYWAEAVSAQNCKSERTPVTAIVLDEITPEFNFETQYCLNSEEITLPTTSNNGVSGIWSPAIVSTNNLGTTIYEFTPDLECGETITRSITIVEIILPEFDDLIQNYCLNSDEIQTLPNLSDNGISGAWFPNQINTNIQGTTTYTFTPDDGQCSEDFELNVTVYPHPDMDLEEELLICEGDSFTYTAPDGFDSYEWKNEQNQIISQSQTVTFTQEGIYTLTVEINGIPCDLSRSIEVRFSTPPTITEIKTTENTLTVYATGGNPLEYSMNQVFWQSSPTFTNLQPGIYHVYVRDAKGCSTTAKQAGLLGASNFISPNGDGYNDTWEIRGLEAYPNTRLQIFDRYGKIFVDKILDSSFIWDGKYNSQPLPSESYWYILILDNGDKISGHISIRNY